MGILFGKSVKELKGLKEDKVKQAETVYTERKKKGHIEQMKKYWKYKKTRKKKIKKSY